MEKAKTEILEYLNKVKKANKELTKKEAFKDLLNRLYAGNKEILAIVDAISKGAEATVLNIPREDKLHKGSADTLYNNVIIEFENNLGKTGKHAKEQLAGYLLGQFKSGEGYNYTLIASDFVNWKVYAPDISCIENLENLNEHELILNEIPTASFTLTENNAEAFYFYLDRFLFKEEKRKATLKLIEEAFGHQSHIFIESYRLLNNYFQEAKKYGEVQVSYEQWKKFLSIAYGSFDAGEGNFLIHTYLSVFAKMLAYSVVSNDEYISDDDMKGILDGSIFHRMHISNFVDNDFFHWVKSDNNFNKLKNVFRLIAQGISGFDFHDVEEDVLKGVYQELIDIDTRHALGEYYTPDWLCEKITEEYNFTKTDKILDPSCGSGSFLRAIIHRIRKLNPDASVEEISKNVYGIDIHPLSVQIAKTTLLLALGKEVRKSKKPVHLNIFLANTLHIPEGTAGIFGSDFLMTIDRKKFMLNTQILESETLYDEALEVCEQLAELTIGKKAETPEAFLKILTNKYKAGGITHGISESFYTIYKALKEVKEDGRDSIWKFIIQNSYKPYLLRDCFHYVIGNPPWFTYKSIKNEEYQETLNRLAVKYDVKPESQANFTHLEIAAIFLAYCSSYFLKDKGKIAFVLPRSFFSADHHDKSRSGQAKGFKITNLWDLNDVNPLFRVPSCAIFAEKAHVSKALPKGGLAGKNFAGRLPNSNCNLQTAAPKLHITNETFYYSKQGKSSAFSTSKVKAQTKENPYKKLFKQGATIVPRNFYFIELTQEMPDDFEDRILTIKTSDAVKPDAKMPWKEVEMEGRIESQFVFRTALSKSILPFALYKPDLVVLPITIEKDNFRNDDIKLHSPEDLRAEGHLHASKWFQNVENIWNIYKTENNKNITAADYINWQNKLTDQDLNAEYYVLYSASAKDANSTIIKRTDSDLPFIIESKAYWYSTNNINEAYYLTAILNSETPNEMMKDFQSTGLFGARDVHKKILDIYYPKYVKENALHNELAQLSEQAHTKATTYLSHSAPTENLTAHSLGRLRLSIKKSVADELQAIDKLVKKLLKT